MMRLWIAAVLVLSGGASASAAVKIETIEYTHGDTVLEGVLAYDDAMKLQRPGVMIVHEWKGLGEYAKRRARQLAELGYLAFAIDMYGKGVRASDHQEAAQLSGIYRNDRQLMRSRVAAGMQVLTAHALADREQIAAIGYCFGGTAVLELARSGAAVKGVVSFHGGLGTPTPEDAQQIKGKVLVLHGAKDPHAGPDQVEALKREMDAARVDYQIVLYPNAVHSFTVPDAGDDPSTGVAYDPEADRQSWEAMKQFFDEIFVVSELQNIG